MDREVMERIFDPYFTTKKPGEGTGMGLSVVHGIVRGYGGAIRVSSEPCSGTSFEVLLPRIEHASNGKEAEAREPLPTGTERILLVDDEEALAEMEQLMLERLGYQVTARTGSLEALEAFRAEPHRFDLVITDQTMPNMTGLELCKELLEIRPDIPIILCTGFSDLITPEKAKAMGIGAFLGKPLVRHEIARAIRKLLDKKAG
jgi:CheY-like chemotaxis protein